MLSLLRQRDFGLLWTAGLISISGDFMLLIALPLHVYALTGSALAGGGVYASLLIPRVLLGSIAGVLVDRWDRKRTMVIVDLARAVILLPLIAVGSGDRLWLAYVVPGIAATAGLLFGPAENALLPRLVGEDRLTVANALNALNNNIGRLIGPALGAALYAWDGIAVVVAIDATTYLVAALLIALIVADGRPVRDAVEANAVGPLWRRTAAEWRSGLSVIRRDRALRVILASSCVGFVGEGTFGALGLAPLILDVLEGREGDVGLVASAQAIGGLAGGVGVARLGNRLVSRLMIGGGLIGLGLSDLVTANGANLVGAGRPALIVAMVFMFVAGFPVTAFDAGQRSEIQRRVADAYRGRVFATLSAVTSISILIGLLGGGALADSVGIVPMLSIGCGMWILAGLIVLWRWPAEEPPPAPESLSTVPTATVPSPSPMVRHRSMQARRLRHNRS